MDIENKIIARAEVLKEKKECPICQRIVNELLTIKSIEPPMCWRCTKSLAGQIGHIEALNIITQMNIELREARKDLTEMNNKISFMMEAFEVEYNVDE